MSFILHRDDFSSDFSEELVIALSNEDLELIKLALGFIDASTVGTAKATRATELREALERILDKETAK